MLDLGEGALDRFQLIDMKEEAMTYTSGSAQSISRETYDKLIEGLNRLNNILAL